MLVSPNRADLPVSGSEQNSLRLCYSPDILGKKRCSACCSIIPPENYYEASRYVGWTVGGHECGNEVLATLGELDRSRVS